MKKICEKTQELIATEAALDDSERAHLEICDKCNLLLNEYQSMKLLVSDLSDTEVPLGFADAVMNKIESAELQVSMDWMQKISLFWERIMMVPQAQYLALVIGFVVSFINLVRFVFFVLIPAA